MPRALVSVGHVGGGASHTKAQRETLFSLRAFILLSGP